MATNATVHCAVRWFPTPIDLEWINGWHNDPPRTAKVHRLVLHYENEPPDGVSGVLADWTPGIDDTYFKYIMLAFPSLHEVELRGIAWLPPLICQPPQNIRHFVRTHRSLPPIRILKLNAVRVKPTARQTLLGTIMLLRKLEHVSLGTFCYPLPQRLRATLSTETSFDSLHLNHYAAAGALCAFYSGPLALIPTYQGLRTVHSRGTPPSLCTHLADLLQHAAETLTTLLIDVVPLYRGKTVIFTG